MLYNVVLVTDDGPTFTVPLSEILAECEVGGAIEILSPVEYHTAQQRKWYKGVCLKGLSEWNGDTPEEWDYRIKHECGDQLLKREVLYMGKLPSGAPAVAERLTIVGVGRLHMTAFIENILSAAIKHQWPVTPPDPELRRL